MRRPPRFSQFLLLLGGLLLPLTGWTGQWIPDPITGTEVWAKGDKPNQSVSWSGAAQDGKAHGPGILTWIDDGEIAGRFIGEMVHGKAEGIGELWFRRDDGFIHYTGEIAESEIHGVGIARLPNGTLVQGEFAHDTLNGRVKITREDGSNYTGFVVDNEPHGRGIQITADGEKYLGEFLEGKREGHGTLVYTNGDLYEGEFQNDLPHGTGQIRTVEGGQFTGPFIAGKPHGEGDIVTPSGETTRGPLVNGKPHGDYTLVAADGSTRVETWQHGEKVTP